MADIGNAVCRDAINAWCPWFGQEPDPEQGPAPD
jgi:hypothetical protein